MHHSARTTLHHDCIPGRRESSRTAAPVTSCGAVRRGGAELFVPSGQWALLGSNQ